ncbi:4-hydroxybenzoate octaprenyltransferase [Candidatus Bealeia paramacronuclearis]|uniref:4-hydroxybenzoate octaprenyltransferase n=1 Tax=Candidatus Bealeia paramacronuclearis TaxID=1921001 RepID=A0ABZ2BZZ9_9PROT|nr:4-hydroxybenzoate octaprenyltransferase [Candidatus Bealeia paramacronuclearis]
MQRTPILELLFEIMRLHRPVGIWLLMFPCWWGVAYTSSQFPNPWFLMLFAVGSTVMRGAGCIYNDIVDHDLDKKVARTQNRPLARGDLTIPQAIIFMIVLGMIGALILFQFPDKAIAVGLCSLVLVILYPFMKRITYWPQVFLGLTFNWGIWVAWAASGQSLSLGLLFLYLGGILWTLGYDTIYACQDREDDLLMGMKSSAIKFGGSTKPALVLIYSGALFCWSVAGHLAGFHKWFYGGILAMAFHFAWQVLSLDIHHPKNCGKRFVSNIYIGAILFITIVIGKILN